MATTCRLIRQGDLDAALNMSIDEAILLSHTERKSPPTIRFYGWDKPSISLGYFQDPERGLDLQRIRACGIQLVRRLTGGRAVLHGHDLTFSIVVGSEALPAANRSIRGSHAWLMQGIVGGLRALGLNAQLGRDESGSARRSADCFANIAPCDVIVGERKVAGSAQVRRGGIILEQGSIPLREPPVALKDVLGTLYTEAQEPNELDRESLANAIIGSFADKCGLLFHEASLLPVEITTASSLSATWYENPQWTLHGGRVR